jgi:hypothetical protein
MCDRAGLSQSAASHLCLRMTAVPPRHRVSSQFCSDFYNVNHIYFARVLTAIFALPESITVRSPKFAGIFVDAFWVWHIWAGRKEGDVNVGRTRILVIQIDSCIQCSQISRIMNEAWREARKKLRIRSKSDRGWGCSKSFNSDSNGQRFAKPP